MRTTQTEARSVLAKTFLILDTFRGSEGVLRASEIVTRTRLPKATVHRLVAQLLDWGALERGSGGLRLGLRLFELGELVPRQRQLREAALPFMEDLYEATHETVHLGILEGTDVLYLAKISGHSRSSAPTRIGGRMPAHCTGLGKAILAYSDSELIDLVVARGMSARTPSTIVTSSALRRECSQIASRGVAFDHEEAQRGLVCVAAPIFGSAGVIAALSIASRHRNMDLERVAPAVRTATLALSRTLTQGY